ncbi:hypothetical protein AVEN_55713-1 [Araneus ventricosus]|uniref:Uncharacterized protein n=1 Tax=Araneus ventricosus TaxID=182803 RepID=A0A4Y2UBD7_ARAVE|nr:hypothetical protein AVEN_55713-1 [Araneus ventricosus]
MGKSRSSTDIKRNFHLSREVQGFKLCYMKGEKVSTPLDKDGMASGPITHIRLRHCCLLRSNLTKFFHFRYQKPNQVKLILLARGIGDKYHVPEIVNH